MAGIKKTLFKHLNDDIYCRLGVSKVHGVGVFAIRPIPKGVKPLNSLVKLKELEFSREELEALPKSVRKQLEIFCYYVGDTFYIPSTGLNCVNMAVYVNHSKKPNLRFKKDGSLQAIKNIKKGEELMIDYDISFGDTHQF
jgi:SET domain-containing protein